MYDARAIANCILDCAERRGITCSNLKLQKLLFFVHGEWLRRSGEPLCVGEFEAWQHGPVHPTVYDCFREFGADSISSRAKMLDPVSRNRCQVSVPDDIRVIDIVNQVVNHLGHLTGSQLRNLTHAVGSPWSIVVENSSNSANIGMKIPNALIRSNFGKHLYLIGEGSEERGLNENAPYS